MVDAVLTVRAQEEGEGRDERRKKRAWEEKKICLKNDKRNRSSVCGKILLFEYKTSLIFTSGGNVKT